MSTGLGGWLLRLAAELAGPRGTPRELAGRRCRTPEDSRRTLAGTGAGLCRTSKDAPSCRGSCPFAGSQSGLKRTTSDPREVNQNSFRAHTRPGHNSTSRGPRQDRAGLAETPHPDVIAAMIKMMVYNILTRLR